MKIIHTQTSRHDFQNLPTKVQKRTERKLALFLGNPRYPSLQIKKMEGHDTIWEGRITDMYRFTFQIQDDCYILRRIGTHDILKTP